MALIAAHLNAEVILVVTCSDRYFISLSPTPFSSSLINLVVYVDVKHHVYLLRTFSELRSCVKVGVDVLGSRP